MSDRFHCVECGVRLSAEDVELNDDLCDACRQGVIYQEVYDERWEREWDFEEEKDE